MQPLLPSDPSRVGPHRLLCRLGAGGMGVVYLGRTSGGALAAVKVVRAAHAGDAAFRARFRREVRAADRVRSPWVAPLLGAGTEERTPWLATAYVPGPSVAEAVESCGPLPRASAAVLGVRLAEALDAVHAAGLVHRDVKPGNVLLALDGPRLIDFGIAREPADTALTGTGTVVGSPGFLSPEQARGTGAEIGPPSDVFSLGCLLAFAVTGNRPFGDGSPAAVLVRTAYEEPDLTGVPASLVELLRACLDKDPEGRPDAAEVGAALDGTPRTADWVPEAVVRLIAQRSAAALAIPAAQPTELDAAGSGPRAPASGGTAPEVSGGTAPEVSGTGSRVPGPGPEDGAVTLTAAGSGPLPGPSRRHLLRWASAAAALAAAGGGTAWWVRERRNPPATSPGARRERFTVALHADLSGDRGTLGRAQERGTRIAVDEINSGTSWSFQLDLLVRDDGGEPDRARAVAAELAADDRVLAVLGPSDDDCAAAVVDRYQQALLAMVSVSLGRSPARTLHTHRVFVATRPVDDALAAPLTAHLSRTVRTRHTVLLADAAQGDAGWSMCRGTARALGERVRTEVRTVAADTDARGFAALAERVVDSGADAVVFVGGTERTAHLARALGSGGFTGARLGTHHAMAPAFPELAGQDAQGWVFATPFLDPLGEDSTAAFTAAHRERFDGADPPWYAAEAYDAALFLAQAVTDLGGGAGVERGGLVRQLRESRYEGITKSLGYDAGVAAYNTDGLYLFAMDRGAFVYRGRAVGSAG
ncbi:bifunctional serine/threonine-protein kinase/ABC transporter substrate-binding protein [Streptomyces poriticola]|uniref:bifunctional serine/threonine-protein kinase/ABC transporter substrate-binding protein n=1 Tax=Streptomyces poriticola TaxID=3120506 RepID=UPI002FCE0491